MAQDIFQSHAAPSSHKMAKPAKARKPGAAEPRSQATSFASQASQTKEAARYVRCIANDFRIIPTLPITILQDIVSIYHLLSLDPSAPTLAAEKAALETFCSLIWGYQIWQDHLAFARRYFGRHELLLAEDIRMARSSKHGPDCVYRLKGMLLFHAVLETVKEIDAELGGILESCRGDWMVRFRSCGGAML